MQATIWDQRYGAAEFAYGTAPNVFFAQEIEKLEPGELLLKVKVAMRYMQQVLAGSPLLLIVARQQRIKHCF